MLFQYSVSDLVGLGGHKGLYLKQAYCCCCCQSMGHSLSSQGVENIHQEHQWSNHLKFSKNDENNNEFSEETRQQQTMALQQASFHHKSKNELFISHNDNEYSSQLPKKQNANSRKSGNSRYIKVDYLIFNYGEEQCQSD